MSAQSGPATFRHFFGSTNHSRKATCVLDEESQSQASQPGALAIERPTGRAHLLIVPFLPPESTAAFAFYSKPINDILGQHFWNAWEIRKEKKALLFLLGKDMPSHIAFQACRKLHKVEKSPVRQAPFDDLPYTKNDIATNTYTAINKSLGTRSPKSLCSGTNSA
ncbi:hypothetical protein BDZ45DRAFT_806710 [Acephala macrosclerotiorum]|nr:hypothetical protein BDZ45DRAFT_806710 [Acephala macrosclerotiorum]